jgi:sugar lactone lactonase YvrE
VSQSVRLKEECWANLLFNGENMTCVKTMMLLATAALALGAASAADRTQITVKDSQEYPESITSTKDGAVIFGSISKGIIYRSAPGSMTAEPWIQPSSGNLKNVLGVFADERGRTLWVCSLLRPVPGQPEPTPDTALKAFDLKTGAFKKSYDFPDHKGVCNDIAVAKDGTVYVTETGDGKVLRLKSRSGNLEVWASDPLLASADGIGVLADGAIYVNGVRTGNLVRIALKADGSAGGVTKLETSRSLVRPDGMRAAGANTLLLAEGEGRADEVTINGEKAEIKVLKDDFKDGPTAVTLVGQTVFVLEAKLNYLNDEKLRGQDPGPFHATAVPYPSHK